MRWLAILLLACHSVISAATVSLSVVVRDHIARKSTEQVITGKLWDSTAGSWVGTRPWIQGLPTPTYDWSNGTPKMRFPLSPNQALVGWPGRIAVRLDYPAMQEMRQQCSGILVGPRYAMTAAHCLHSAGASDQFDSFWVTDSFYVRPGYNLGASVPGYDKVRVLKSWISKAKFVGGAPYAGDDEWAVMELEEDIGTELGWARVIPIDYSKSTVWIHQLSYPLIPPTCATGKTCDTASRTDTLCHSWAPVDFYGDMTALAWTILSAGWGGESGSDMLTCRDDSCHTGKADVIGVRWTRAGISAIDSVMSGILATILKDVKVPTTNIMDREPAGFELRMISNALTGLAPRDGEWQIMSLDGRVIGVPAFGRNLSVSADRLPRGVALVVFRAPGQAPITRRWIGR